MSELHDCPFDLDRATFDEATHTWTGFFLRPLWDDPRVEQRRISIFSVRTQLPVVEATLNVGGVNKCVVADNARIGRYSFEEIQIIPNGVRLHFTEALDIDLELGAIDANYEEQPLPELCAIYRQCFLVQSGPFIERVAA
ncbi:MAG TPA: hypothetical protein VFZ40_06520 [Pyrinomonadaceae bacterium]